MLIRLQPAQSTTSLVFPAPELLLMEQDLLSSKMRKFLLLRRYQEMSQGEDATSSLARRTWMMLMRSNQDPQLRQHRSS